MSFLIQLKNVSVTLSHYPVLIDINISLEAGKILTILGPNGAGKSTLIRSTIGLLKPTTGSIKRIIGLTIGYVPQKIYIDSRLNITVDYFMNLSNGNKYKNSTLTILKKLNADHLMYTPLQKLSGGETQRVLLARALLHRPQLLVLDEPTQGLDLQGQIEIYDLINNLRDELNCAVLMVSHNVRAVINKTDEILYLNHYIHCSGTPSIVLKNSKFIEMFGLY